MTYDWPAIRARAKELKSDGCTCVPDFFKDCCLLHDIYYRTHKDLDGNPITKEAADLELKKCIQSRSWFKRWSPMAQWRYWAVLRFGKKGWEK